MEPINISKLIKKYGPGYVAKSRKTGQVLAHAKRIDLLFKKTGKKSNIIISWVPKSDAKYVFRISFYCSAVETENDSMPLLLGRKDIFEEKFNLFLDSKRKITVISKNSI